MLILDAGDRAGDRLLLLLNNSVGLPESATDGIVIFTNALMAIPYALKSGKPNARYYRPLWNAVPSH